jgi:hypothetical protein
MLSHETPNEVLEYHIVVCQEEGMSAFNDQLALVLINALSRLDPIGNYGGQFIYHRELYTLCGGKGTEWLSDEITQCCAQRFLESAFITSNKHVVNSIHPAVFLLFLDQLYEVPPEGGLRKSSTKHYRLDESAVPKAYEHAMELWPYSNIFEFPNEWFFSVVNYPNNQHWLHIGILARERSFFVYDPMYVASHTDTVGLVVKAYLTCEFNRHNSVNSIDTTEIPTWKQVAMPGQKQPDSHNCGVLSLISFFRAVRILNDNTATTVAALTNKEMELCHFNGCI